MQLRPDVHTVLFILLVSLLGHFVWRTAAALAAQNPATQNVSTAMFSISG